MHRPNVFIGIAQEKARVPRTIRKGFGEGEGTIPWIDYTTAMVNHFSSARRDTSSKRRQRRRGTKTFFRNRFRLLFTPSIY